MRGRGAAGGGRRVGYRLDLRKHRSFVVHEPAEHDGGAAFAGLVFIGLVVSGVVGGGWELGRRGEDAELEVGGDGFDRGGAAGRLAGVGEVLAGDLEAVEEQTGAARVELLAGDAFQDAADGELDGSPVFGHGERQRSLLRAMARESVWATRGVVVVTEGLAAEAGAFAAVAGGEDVAALLARGLRFGCFE